MRQILTTHIGIAIVFVIWAIIFVPDGDFLHLLNLVLNWASSIVLRVL